MKKVRLFDWLFGLLLTLVVAGAFVRGSGLLETVELKFYDFRSTFREDLRRPDDVAIVAIDDDSRFQLGRWPWPRSRIAAMLDKLNAYGPKVVGLDIPLSEPDRNDPGIAALDELAKRYKQLAASGGAPPEMLNAFEAAKQRLDEDAKLASALKSRKVVLPMTSEIGPSPEGDAETLPPEVARFAVSVVPSPTGAQNEVRSPKISYPLLLFSSAAAGIGQADVVQDTDGSVRRAPMAVSYGDGLYPAYPLEILRVYLGLDSKELKIVPAERLLLGDMQVPLDSNGLLNITYRGPEKTFFHYSFVDVLNDKVGADVFKDRIVLIGPTTGSLGPKYVTPAGSTMAGVEIVANVVEDLLKERVLVRPSWASTAEFGLILLMGVFVSFVLPRLNLPAGTIVSLLLLVFLLGGGTWLFVSQNKWLKMTYPAVLLTAGYTVLVARRVVVAEEPKAQVKAAPIETSKMLGLSLQAQGMLTLAFEKFRACPLDESVAHLLYNLGAEFERKRQPTKAVAVYEYVATKFKTYKDIPAKLETLKPPARTAAPLAAAGPIKDVPVVTKSSSSTRTFGGYEVEKELGRDANGIIYLGKHPKTKQSVEIRTVALKGTAEEIKELRTRFFHQVRTAGHLNHPNIVRLLEAGEEDDIGYITFDFFPNHNLKGYVAKGSPALLATVLDYCAQAANALDYAHRSGVIHRNINPVNIIALDDGTVRITGFDAEPMGTPAYQSPEQASAQNVDGRTDLWSLGVTLQELCTGEMPSQTGGALGARPDLPADLVAIIDKCLRKNPDERYQTGSEVEVDLHNLLQRMRSGKASAAADKTVTLGEPSQEQAPAGGDSTVRLGDTEDDSTRRLDDSRPKPAPEAAPDRTQRLRSDLS